MCGYIFTIPYFQTKPLWLPECKQVAEEGHAAKDLGRSPPGGKQRIIPGIVSSKQL